MRVPKTNDARLPDRSHRLFGLFRWYVRRYVGRHFHAVRVSRSGPLPDLPRGPVIVVLNHPSWWDPLIAVLLTASMPAGRVHYGPIEAVGLDQYRFLVASGSSASRPGRWPAPGDSSSRAWPSWPGPSRYCGSRRRVPSWTRDDAPRSCDPDRPSRPSPVPCDHRADGDRVPVLGRSMPRSPGPIRTSHRGDARRRAIRPRMDGIDRDGAATDARWSGRGVHVSRLGPVRDRDYRDSGRWRRL